MQAHPGLSRTDALKYGPSKILLMVASEFGRAGDLANHPDKARACLERARELMGLLETIDLPEHQAQMLAPYFQRSRREMIDTLLGESPEALREICQDFAERFELLAR